MKAEDTKGASAGTKPPGSAFNRLKSRLGLNRLSGQLTWMILLILLVAQISNTLLLLGDRKLMSSNQKSDAALERLLDTLEWAAPDIERLIQPSLPSGSLPHPGRPYADLPQPLAEGGATGGMIVLNRINRAERMGQRDEGWLAEKTRQALLAKDIEVLSIVAKSRAIDHNPEKHNNQPRAQDWPAEPLNTHSPPPLHPPGSPFSTHFPGEPSVNRQGDRPAGLPPRPESGSGLYHPAHSPDRQGAPAAGLRELLISVEIAPGIWVNSASPYYDQEVISSRVARLTLAIALISIFAIGWLVNRLTRPLQQLSQTANRMGRGLPAEVVPEQGPEDICATAVAFNQMQTRLNRVIDTQHGLLRAVSHDLRTPLTAMRIRVESIPDSDNRDAMIRSLDDMRIMTEDMLAWAIETGSSEEPSRVELTALLESLVDDYQEQGKAVLFEAPMHQQILVCRRVALRRAIRNLIDNALKYAGQAEVFWQQEKDQIVIQIQDAGPGIPEHQLETVMQPFVRLEASRNRDTGGSGLGLSISRSVIEAHGGKLALNNRPEGGLIARIELPESSSQIAN